MDIGLKEEENTEETSLNKAKLDNDSTKSPNIESLKSCVTTSLVNALQQQLEGGSTNVTTLPSSSSSTDAVVECEQNSPTPGSFKDTIKSKLFQLLNDPDPIKKRSKVKIISNVVLKSPSHESLAGIKDDDPDLPVLTRNDNEGTKRVSKPDSEEEDLDPPLLTRIGTTIRTYPGKRNVHPATPPEMEAMEILKDEIVIKPSASEKTPLKKTSSGKGLAEAVTNLTKQKTPKTNLEFGLKDKSSSVKQNTVLSIPISPKKRNSPKKVVEAAVQRKSPAKSNIESNLLIKRKREVATLSQTSSKQSVSGTPNASPKKRSWKRKSEALESDLEHQKVSKVENEHVASSRKSGRHRKPVNYVALAGLNKELEAETSGEDSEDSIEAGALSVKESPGRNRKENLNDSVVGNSGVGTPDDSVSTPLVKRKRGRPRKIVVSEETQSPDKNLKLAQENTETNDSLKQTVVLSVASRKMALSNKDDDENTSNRTADTLVTTVFADVSNTTVQEQTDASEETKPKEIISAQKSESSVSKEKESESEAQKIAHHVEEVGSSIGDKESETSKELKTTAEDCEITDSEVIQDLKADKIDKSTSNTTLTEPKSENQESVDEKKASEKTSPTCVAEVTSRDLQTKTQDDKVKMSNIVGPKSSITATSAISVSPATPKKRGRPPWKHLNPPKSNSSNINIGSDATTKNDTAAVESAEISESRPDVIKTDMLDPASLAKSPDVKRRGRPPKRKRLPKLSTSETCDSEPAVTTDTEFEGASTSAKDLEKNDTALSVDSTTSTLPARKRGYLKKHLPEETSKSETDSPTVTRSGRRINRTSYKFEENESDEEQVKTKIKTPARAYTETLSLSKRLGRPRKRTSEAMPNHDNGAVTSSKDSEINSPVVKKWGRPKKSTVTESKSKGKDEDDEDFEVVEDEMKIVPENAELKVEMVTIDKKPVTVFGQDHSGNLQVASYKSTVNTLMCSIKKETKDEEKGVKDEVEPDIKRLERQTESAVDTKTVTCGVCHNSMEKILWQYHKQRHHNNLAWKTDEPALDLDNPKVVMNILGQLRKRNKPLYCSKCGAKKKSPVGYLSHLTMCQKSQEEIAELKIKCHLCERLVLPVSMIAHLNFYHNDKKSGEIIETDNADLGKRSAAKKAINLIKNWNSSSGVQEVDGGEFIKTEQGYECKHCEAVYSKKAKMVIHVNRVHKNDDYKAIEHEGEEDDADELEDAEYGSKQKRLPRKSSTFITGKKNKMKFIADEEVSLFTFKPAYSWTLKFCEENFAHSGLYEELAAASDWKKADLSVIADYLPKLKYSAYVEFLTDLKKYVDPIRLDCEWKRFKLFESKVHKNGDISIFCGGAINSISWMPTSTTEPDCDQILVVSAALDPDKVHDINQLSSEPGLLQFWNCGSLMAISQGEQSEPQLEFCIMHDYGTVWHMEWCPSGCYRSRNDNSTVSRYGLLAIACSDSFVYIYSIWKQAESSGKMFQPKPVFKLILDRNDKAQVTKISWTKASGHKYIAAGYSNGMVAVFNLTTTNTLLESKDKNGICELLPFRVIQAHNHAVTGLSLYHLNEGRRWLLTTSLDKTVKYWDLDNPIAPISNFFKTLTTDAAWMTHWICTLQTYDDYLGNNRTQLLQLRNFGVDRATMIPSNSRVSTVTTSEWFNGIAHGTVTGELNTIFTQQLITGEFKRNANKHLKFMISYARLVEKDASIEDRLAKEIRKADAVNDKQPQKAELDMNSHNLDFGYEPLGYREAIEKYAVVFCDFKKDTRKDAEAFEETSELFPNTQPNIYPLQSVTKVAFNPNNSSCIYLASGYQAGIVRVSRLSFLSSVLEEHS